LGRPSTFTQEIADEICERLSKGEPLAAICRDDRMPAYRTVYDWQANDEQFSANIARAREAGFDQIAIDALNIADATHSDTIRDPESGSERPNTEWITRSRLRVETRLKLLAKWDPKRYGDRQLLGSDPDNPLPAGVTVSFRNTDADGNRAS
jgi:hypothetical protein